MLKKIHTLISALLLTTISLVGETAIERPLQTTETHVAHLLPTDCLVPEASDPFLLTSDGGLWMVKSKRAKYEQLEEGDPVKITRSLSRGLLTQPGKQLTMGVQRAGTSDMVKQELKALTGFTSLVSYALVDDFIFMCPPTILVDEQNNQEAVPSICQEWLPGEELMLAIEPDSSCHLINPARHELGNVYPMGEADTASIVAVRELTFEMDDGRSWTVFPNFYVDVEEWEPSEALSGLVGDLEEFFGDPEEMDQAYLDAIMEFFGDPNWESWSNKEVMLAINPDYNEMAPFWREKE